MQDRERQIPYDFTYMQNLNNNINEQTKQKKDSWGNRLVVARGERVGGLGEKGEGTEKYRQVVTEQSWGYKVQHRKYIQQYCNNYVWCHLGTGSIRKNDL